MENSMEEREFIIDLEGAGSEEEVQERIEEALPLPEYYGENLDALYDVLTEYGNGWHIRVLNTDDVDDDVRRYVDDMMGVFEDASAVVDDLKVEIGDNSEYDDDFDEDEYDEDDYDDEE
ncbi:MAG: barstar family protein [Lachnospiraceae bacterium]|nr:barstar family protein [Lachnospiraceae bacterium]